MPQPKRQQLGGGVRATRQFTDRQDARMAFQHALHKPQDQYRILVYQGWLGLGRAISAALYGGGPSPIPPVHRQPSGES